MQRFLFLMTILLVCCGASQAQCTAPFKVGFRGTVNANGVTTVIWYPSTGTEASVNYGLATKSSAGAGSINGSIAVDAPVNTCGKFPLIIHSHGDNGCNINSAHLTENWARQGYIVAAANYRDATCGANDQGTDPASYADYHTWTDQTRVDRRDDFETVLNYMLANTEFLPAIDQDRIGASGHSLGGYTTLGILGGWASWKDSRVKVGMLLSPYLLPYTLDNRLKGITAPVVYEGGTLDIAVTPFISGDVTQTNPSGISAYNLSPIPKIFANITGATHFSFATSVCRGTATAPTTVADCVTSVQIGRLSLQYSQSFFDRFLKGLDRPALWSTTSGLADFKRVSQSTPVSTASYKGGQIATSSIASAFGDQIAPRTESALTQPLPSAIAGVAVLLTDSTGATQRAPLFFVSPGQINFQVPDNVAAGTVTVSVRNGAGVNVGADGTEVSSGTITVQRIVPGLFTVKNDVVPAAQWQIAGMAGPGGYVYDGNSLNPIGLNQSSGQLYIIFYATGVRNASSATATIGGRAVPATQPAAVSGFIGLDQINVGPIPANIPSGAQDVAITVDGVSTNTVQLVFQ